MKGCTSIQKYKKHQKTLYARFLRNKLKIKRRKLRHQVLYAYSPLRQEREEIPITAPNDFQLLEVPDKCIYFFYQMRSVIRHRRNNRLHLNLDLSKVASIDFPTVVLFKAVIRELLNKGISVGGTLPDDADCRQFLKDAGFLRNMFDASGHKFEDTGKSVILKIEKGNGRLTTKQSQMLSDLIRKSSEHLHGKYIPHIRLKSVLKEICGNSIEWGDAFSMFWMVGAKFEDNKVVFVATDLGQGILNSLKRKFPRKVIDWLTKSDVEILEGAFNRKYGSASEEENRNNGLPSIKALNDDRQIKNLGVITNNVLLNFDNKVKSSKFATKRTAFMGTLYTWELDFDCQNC